jgi:hypothetical protein
MGNTIYGVVTVERIRKPLQYANGRWRPRHYRQLTEYDLIWRVRQRLSLTAREDDIIITPTPH